MTTTGRIGRARARGRRLMFLELARNLRMGHGRVLGTGGPPPSELRAQPCGATSPAVAACRGGQPLFRRSWRVGTPAPSRFAPSDASSVRLAVRPVCPFRDSA